MEALSIDLSNAGLWYFDWFFQAYNRNSFVATLQLCWLIFIYVFTSLFVCVYLCVCVCVCVFIYK